MLAGCRCGAGLHYFSSLVLMSRNALFCRTVQCLDYVPKGVNCFNNPAALPEGTVGGKHLVLMAVALNLFTQFCQTFGRLCQSSGSLFFPPACWDPVVEGKQKPLCLWLCCWYSNDDVVLLFKYRSLKVLARTQISSFTYSSHYFE